MDTDPPTIVILWAFGDVIVMVGMVALSHTKPEGTLRRMVPAESCPGAVSAIVMLPKGVHVPDAKLSADIFSPPDAGVTVCAKALLLISPNTKSMINTRKFTLYFEQLRYD